MVIIDIPQALEKLNKFASDEWDKTLAYLQGTFSLSRSDCEDVFQDAFIILHNVPHIRAVEEEKLILLLIMQMMRIGQSEKEKDRHTEENGEE